MLSTIYLNVQEILEGFRESVFYAFHNVEDRIDSTWDNWLEGKTAIVTGANSGVGLATAQRLASLGCHVVLACRSRTRGEEALKSVHGDAELMLLDLSSLDSVREFAKRFTENHKQLNLLVLNAGLLNGSYEETAEGFESNLGVNYIGHFLLTYLLLDSLARGKRSRVLCISSSMSRFGEVDLQKLEAMASGKRSRAETRKSSFGRVKSYAESKLMNVLHAYELNRRFSKHGISSFSINPGVVRTNILRDRSLFIRYGGELFWYLTGSKTPFQGSTSVIFAACHPDLHKVGGSYVSDSIVERAEFTADEQELARRLWDVTCKLTAVDSDRTSNRRIASDDTAVFDVDEDALKEFGRPHRFRYEMLFLFLSIFILLIYAIYVLFFADSVI